MAKSLNQSRRPLGWLLMLVAGLILIFTAGYIPDEGLLHEFNDVLGFLLVVMCTFGRVFTTAFIGGLKNTDLIATGPYGLVRNPLYFFSFLGVLGLGVMSNRLSVLLLLVGGFALIYSLLIRREEAYLQQKFGAKFTAYCQRVPALLPRWGAKMVIPPEVTIRPQYLLNAMRDASGWYLAVVLLELIERLHAMGWLGTWGVVV